jgi:hypothetical protein
MADRLDFSATWADATGLLRAHSEGLGAIAGLFLFMPDWASRMLVTPSAAMEAPANFTQLALSMQEQFATYWYILIPVLLLKLFGAVALYVLLTRRDLPSIGAALRMALPILPFYVLAEIAVGLLTGFGFVLLILPGLYLIGRFAPLGPVVVAERTRDPLGAIGRAWDMTRNKGWAIFFLLFVVAIILVILSFVIEMLVGLPSKLFAGPEGIPLLQNGVAALLATFLTLVTTALTVAIYRQLSGSMSQ